MPQIDIPMDRHSSPKHHRMVVAQDRLAKGVIWLFAGLCFIVLMGIIGFILVNGLLTTSNIKSEFLPVAIRDIPLTGYPGKLHIYVNDDIRVKSLDARQVEELLSGDTVFWGYISGQNRKVTLAVADDPNFIQALTDDFLVGDNALSSNLIRIGSKDELKQLADRHKGVVFFAPDTPSYKGFDPVLKKFKPVELQEFMIGVSAPVKDLYEGRRLTSLSWDKGQVEAILSGEISDWHELGFYENMPLRLIAPPIETRAAHALPLFDAYADSSEQAEDVQTFAGLFHEGRGTVGIVTRKLVRDFDMQTIEVEYTQRAANLRLSFLTEAPSRAGAVGGISTVILNTLAMVLFVLLIATPLGVTGAVYLSEYAKAGPFLKILRIGIDTLAGIPSILFGLFGFVFFSTYLGLKTGLLSGTMTLTLMILPTIIRTSEEAIRSVPQHLRHASYAIGATRHQTVWQIVIPAAVPGILTGVILGIGRAIGETAALLFTMGSNLSLLKSLNSPMRVLSVHLYMLIRENVSIPNAFATATILLLMVLAVNYLTKRTIGSSRQTQY
ncbi:MAG: phosphate ABC transporter permease PstA [Spirochaetales bacterium]|nr:phosphate ABC transporter permease PstA [Spirochaetales bacterium]